MTIPETVWHDDDTTANEDIKCELLDGVLFIHSPANQEHEDIFSLLLALFRYYLVNTGQGKVFGSRFVMRLSEKWNPEPDLVVVTSDHLDKLGEGRLNGPADIVVDILSDATRAVDLEDKIPRFLEMGVREAWIIDPEQKVITVKWQDDHVVHADPGSDEPVISRVLPGLNIPVSWIWNRDAHPSRMDLDRLVSG